MGNTPPVKKQTERERLKELAEANFHKTHEFKAADPSEKPEVKIEPEVEREKVDWDNIDGNPKKPSDKVKADAKEVILDGKITSVAQINWKHDELNPDAEHVTVYHAMEEYDKKLELIKQESNAKQKILDDLENEEKERLRRERGDDSMFEDSDGRGNEEEYHNEEGEELMLKSSSSMLDDEEEVDEGPDPLYEEESILYDLFNCTQPWSFPDNEEEDIYGWNDDVSVTEWTGITCGKPVSIQSLRLLKSQDSFMDSQQVEEKVVEDDDVSGGNVKMTVRGFVRRLYLDHMFSMTSRLPLIGWNKLTSIKILSLSHNNLEGEIPMELGSCHTLQVLNLSCNKLGGEIPVELSSLSQLTHLWLYANQLEGKIPSNLFSLDGCYKLNSIRLKRNCLDGEIPSGIGSLNHLEEVDIEENKFNGSLPETITKLTKLKVLKVAKNELTGPLPVQYFELMSSLKDLRFYHNKFDQHTISKMGVMRTVSTVGGFDF